MWNDEDEDEIDDDEPEEDEIALAMFNRVIAVVNEACDTAAEEGIDHDSIFDALLEYTALIAIAQDGEQVLSRARDCLDEAIDRFLSDARRDGLAAWSLSAPLQDRTGDALDQALFERTLEGIHARCLKAKQEGIPHHLLVDGLTSYIILVAMLLEGERGLREARDRMQQALQEFLDGKA